MVAGRADPSAPIGVFDSGIGGLTVVAELMRQLPSESIIYFGDTARLPYGPKSPETVRRYSREIAQLLLSQGVKAIVVGCNTATAHALPVLASELPVPVLGVIEPGARAAVKSAPNGPIGVIGTRGTVISGAYDSAIRALAPAIQVTAVACPLFVPIIEEGWYDSEAAELIARQYLAPIAEAQLAALVLGCTHYPLLKPLIGRILHPDVRLIDSAEETAAGTAAMLAARGIAAPPDSIPRYRFIASDAPEQFLDVGRRFLRREIHSVETILLG